MSQVRILCNQEQLSRALSIHGTRMSRMMPKKLLLGGKAIEWIFSDVCEQNPTTKRPANIPIKLGKLSFAQCNLN
ncbi:hypothetical protein EUGRSUZ_H03029 [Eucalyptus grandis]|uniref:Uncharacterized protein n=2 Tax=Eucalyptus grandis TaxID=71139 RepID=A0ACC3JT73_EUCGR|nr:hypothetical protein EUGRSUZ_H03029 [Eucalyptus grandis]